MAGKLTKEELSKEYDKWHQQQVHKFDPSVGKLYNPSLNFLKPRAGGKLLDIGCGQGQFLKLSEERGLVPFGIDISPKAVELAQKMAPNSQIRVGVAEELPWEDNYFDYITCWGSLEHFLNPGAAVTEMARVLKLEGSALITVPNLFFVGHIYMAFRYGLPPDEAGQTFSETLRTRMEWHELLCQYGLKVVNTYKYNPLLVTKKAIFPIVLAYNLIKPFIPFNLSHLFAFACKKDSCADTKNR